LIVSFLPLSSGTIQHFLLMGALVGMLGLGAGYTIGLNPFERARVRLLLKSALPRRNRKTVAI
jgi:hypothetical protein